MQIQLRSYGAGVVFQCGCFTQPHLIPIQSSKYTIVSSLSLFSIDGVLFVLCVASLGEILYLDHFAGNCGLAYALSSQVSTLPKAKSETRSKQNKDMHKCSSVYSERGLPLPVLTSGGE
jgi:hypothetical protein